MCQLQRETKYVYRRGVSKVQHRHRKNWNNLAWHSIASHSLNRMLMKSTASGASGRHISILYPYFLFSYVNTEPVLNIGVGSWAVKSFNMNVKSGSRSRKWSRLSYHQKKCCVQYGFYTHILRQVLVEHTAITLSTTFKKYIFWGSPHISWIL